MELPGTYAFTSTDAEMHAKLEMLVKAMEQYSNKIKEKKWEKKIKKNK